MCNPFLAALVGQDVDVLAEGETYTGRLVELGADYLIIDPGDVETCIFLAHIVSVTPLIQDDILIDDD